MDAQIIKDLCRLSAEEKLILGGQKVKKDDYTLSKEFIVNSEKVLGAREIDMRLHTRFIDFPEHGHDYTEFMYVYAGSITHVIEGGRITLQSGDILLLNKHIRHSILRAGEGDVGINFILSNAFLQVIFREVRNNPVMSEFLTGNFDDAGEEEYLFFRTKDNFPIRNLMDNLIYAVVNRSQEVYAGLVSLLFAYLAYYRDTLVNAQRNSSPDAKLRRAVLGYLEAHYVGGTLEELAGTLGYAPAYLSRRVHLVFGKPFRLLLQEERIRAAEKLLRETSLGVEEIVRAVGYENQSNFYRVFKKMYGMTPHKFRKTDAADSAP